MISSLREISQKIDLGEEKAQGQRLLRRIFEERYLEEINPREKAKEL